MSAPTLHENNPFTYSRPATPQLKQLGFVGIGAMGYFMARNLANRQQPHHASASPLLIWNRTNLKAEQLQKELGQDKIRIARDLAQIATECDVVVTNLANDEVVKSVYEEFSKILQARLRHTPYISYI
jgi:3-hydroxyisobutyrate dehydrogenase-like beta-hydroxyacid dehydrogenase